VRELNVGIVRGDAGYNIAPKTRALENICLIDGKHAAPASARQREGHARHTLNLRLAVTHGVQRMARVLRVHGAFDGARLSEIQSAEQFANDQDIGAADDLFTQRRTRGQRGIGNRRPQIGESAELFANAQQSGFRTQLARIVIEGGSADGSEQNGLRCETGLNRGVRQRIAELTESLAADFFLFDLELVPESARDLGEHANGLGSHFGANAVAGESCDSEIHAMRVRMPEYMMSRLPGGRAHTSRPHTPPARPANTRPIRPKDNLPARRAAR
jgi:hypothetical protein